MIRVGEWVKVNGKIAGHYNFVGLVVGVDRGAWLVYDKENQTIITTCEHLLSPTSAPPEAAGLPLAAMLSYSPIKAAH